MRINLLVIRTKDLELLKNQYELLGFSFEYHRHANGPCHFAAEHDGFVLEIYPLTKSMDKADNSIRLGFELENIEAVMEDLAKSKWIIKSALKEIQWGTIAVVQDLDGRTVELKKKQSTSRKGS